ncbi:MAG: hypothetical protein ACTSP4_00780 [Candidatus Hodarchaeales archaeon]
MNCKKRPYEEFHAEIILLRIQNKRNRSKHRGECRIYKCNKCNKCHLTSIQANQKNYDEQYNGLNEDEKIVRDILVNNIKEILDYLEFEYRLDNIKNGISLIRIKNPITKTISFSNTNIDEYDFMFNINLKKHYQRKALYLKT